MKIIARKRSKNEKKIQMFIEKKVWRAESLEMYIRTVMKISCQNINNVNYEGKNTAAMRTVCQ